MEVLESSEKVLERKTMRTSRLWRRKSEVGGQGRKRPREIG